MAEIPIKNLYYLLCYAWDCLSEGNLVRADAEDSTTLQELLSRVLLSGLAHLRKRGFDRGYVLHMEESAVLRGKLVVGETVKRQLLRKGRAACEFTELSENVLHNQILKATLMRLAGCNSLEKKVRADLWGAASWFETVTRVEVRASDFRRVQLNRNNAFYRFLLNVCELIHANLLVNQGDGSVWFRDFLRDERQMSSLFEKFVGNFYAREQSDFRVSTQEPLRWHGRSLDETSEQYYPTMRLDVLLRGKTRRVVIDTKYYREALRTNQYGALRLHETNLYQVFSYVLNLAHDVPDEPLPEGILLYPAVGYSLDLRYVFCGRPVAIRTVDLGLPWQQIHAELLSILKITGEDT